MDSRGGTKGARTVLWISGMAFGALFLRERRASLWGYMAAAVVLGLFLQKTSVTWERLKRVLRPKAILPGCFVCVLMGCGFCDRWRVSPRAFALAETLGIDLGVLVVLCAAVGVLTAALGVSVCLSCYMDIVVRDFRETDKTGGVSFCRAFCVLAAVYALGISAILRANFNYIDDMGRVAGGYRSWAGYSRFLSETLSPFVHGDRYLTDVSPLPQLLAVLLLALSGVLLLYILYGRRAFSAWEILALVPLGLNPYFLECVSYKYDSPYMALSILGAVFPFLFRKEKTVSYIFISAVGMLVVCTTYQAATGIYPMLAVLLAFRKWNGGGSLKKAAGFCLRSAAGYGLGLAVFYFLVMVPVESYVSSSFMRMGDMAQIVYFNMRGYFSLVGDDFRPAWLVLTAVLAVGYLWAAVWRRVRKAWAAAPAAAGSLALLAVSCFGVYPALSRTLFDPRAMYGFGVFITLMGICAVEGRVVAKEGVGEGSRAVLGGVGAYLFRMSAAMLSLAFFIFSFTYGNALYVQKEYTDFRIQMVIKDLSGMEVFLSGEPVTVQITGTIGQSPVIAAMPQDYNILNRLVPVTFRGEWWWGQAGFYQYYGLKNVVRDPAVDLTAQDLPVLEDGMYHRIRGRDNYILVELK